MKKTALVIGATGLIGRNLVFDLLKNDNYDSVVVFTRRDLVIKHSKLNQIICDFDNLEKHFTTQIIDDVFCCLGSTKSKTPDQKEYRKIDYDYPLEIGKLALKNGAKNYFLVSSMGANKNSQIFYSKLKGEIELAISELKFEGFKIFRPSLLLGYRTELRPLEMFSQMLMRGLNPLFIGPLKKYKAIQGSVVAKAMNNLANKNRVGNEIISNEMIFDLAEELG
jgi:uncharacterized protein YbjT (DUF2867 family)